MICIMEYGYMLKQVEHAGITIVQCPDGSVKKVIGPRLSERTAKMIILEASKP